MINLTDNAKNQISEILSDGEGKYVRAFITGGGCSGFQYGFTFDENQNEDDFVIVEDGVTVLVDAMSMQYLSGAVIGYKTSLMGEQFEIKNPQAQSKCGCGSSFAV